MEPLRGTATVCVPGGGQRPLRQLKEKSGVSKIEARNRPQPRTPQKANSTADDHADLLSLFLHSNTRSGCCCCCRPVFGAAHALTPGHGKTLVAAYLVGQRGTVWHALLLGLVTTVTHTGIVLVLALGLQLFFSGGMSPQTQRDVQTGLGLIMGLLVAGLGFLAAAAAVGGPSPTTSISAADTITITTALLITMRSRCRRESG